jgi:hypothetical protein
MTNRTWTVCVHDNDSQRLTYSVVMSRYDRYGRALPDQLVISHCARDELDRVLNECADVIIQDVLPTWEAPAPS